MKQAITLKQIAKIRTKGELCSDNCGHLTKHLGPVRECTLFLRHGYTTRLSIAFESPIRAYRCHDCRKVTS